MKALYHVALTMLATPGVAVPTNIKPSSVLGVVIKTVATPSDVNGCASCQRAFVLYEGQYICTDYDASGRFFYDLSGGLIGEWIYDLSGNLITAGFLPPPPLCFGGKPIPTPSDVNGCASCKGAFVLHEGQYVCTDYDLSGGLITAANAKQLHPAPLCFGGKPILTPSDRHGCASCKGALVLYEGQFVCTAYDLSGGLITAANAKQLNPLPVCFGGEPLYI